VAIQTEHICGAITKKGEPCQRAVVGRRKWYDKHPGGRSKYRPQESRTCGAITKSGTPCQRSVAGRRKWCDKHPGGRSKSRESSSRQAKKQPQRALFPQVSESTSPVRSTRIARRAKKAATVVDRSWSDSVLQRFTEHVGESGATVAAPDCESIAFVAHLLLSGQSASNLSWERQSSLSRRDAGLTRAANLARDTARTIDLDPPESDIAAARGLQMVGVALCRQAGVSLIECPCFADPAATELEGALFLVLRLAIGDWTALTIPLDLLAYP
jgi:hypothetical protein